MSDKLLNALLQRGEPSESEHGPHLDANTIAELVTGEASVVEREKILPHLRTCSACRKAVNFQLDYNAAPDPAAELLAQVGVAEADRRLQVANLLLAVGRTESALSLFQSVTEHAPQLADAWFGLAQCQQMRQQIDDAIVSFRRCLELDERSTAARARLATLLEQQGRLDEVAAVVKPLLPDFHPSDDDGKTIREIEDRSE